MALYLIGDIQGCDTALQRLLDLEHEARALRSRLRHLRDDAGQLHILAFLRRGQRLGQSPRRAPSGAGEAGQQHRENPPHRAAPAAGEQRGGGCQAQHRAGGGEGRDDRRHRRQAHDPLAHLRAAAQARRLHRAPAGRAAAVGAGPRHRGGSRPGARGARAAPRRPGRDRRLAYRSERHEPDLLPRDPGPDRVRRRRDRKSVV